MVTKATLKKPAMPPRGKLAVKMAVPAKKPSATKAAAAKMLVAKKAVHSKTPTAKKAVPGKKLTAKHMAPAKKPGKRSAPKAAATAYAHPKAPVAAFALPYLAKTLPKLPPSKDLLESLSQKVSGVAKAAKKAATSTMASVAKVVRAQPLTAATTKDLEDLLYRTRAERLLNEVALSDVVVISADSSLPADSAELQTVAALGVGQFASMMFDSEAGPAPEMEIVRRLGTGMAVRANETALRIVRRSSPGLRMYACSYLYLQYLRSLGDELSGHTLQFAATAQVRKVAVRLRDVEGNPVEGVSVKGMVDWLGSNVAATSDSTGLATLSVPVSHARIELFMVEPDHTHWSQFAKGFDLAAAPAELSFVLQRLVPDEFKLIPNYAQHDAEAGKGVRVGVIDSGVGPHVDLTVAGGGCFVTGEDPNDFTDNGIGHGTHVAGIIAAKPESSGLYGMAPACTLMSYRVCPRTGLKGRAQSVDVAAALEQAITDQCDLVNISLGSLEAMPELPDVLAKARDSGMVVFASTGNDGKEVLRYPARYSHALGVGALGRDASFPANSPEKHQSSKIRIENEFVARFSNFGTGTDFIGVGVAVLSTYPNDRYAMMSGTSMAAPFTTGMAARLLSRTPALLTMARGPARTDAIIAMLSQATRKAGWPGTYDGFGVLK